MRAFARAPCKRGALGNVSFSRRRAAADVESYDKIAIGASIRFGNHRPVVYEFIRANQRLRKSRPSAFFSVNVVARKPGYVNGFLRRTTWQPVLLGVFAGKIDYQRYGPVDRLVIRFIMLLTHGPTGTHDCVDFTDWVSVEEFGRRIVALQFK